MRTGLDHLPLAEQRELERVVRTPFEECGAATAGWKRQVRVPKV